MKSHPVFSIPEPCSENWSTMKKESNGRFCNSCVKSVIDFTGMETSEIVSYLKKNQGKNICGRFNPAHVQPTVKIVIPRSIITKQLSFSRAFVVALALAMGTTLLSCKNEQGIKTPVAAVELTTEIEKDTISLKNKTNATSQNTQEKKPPKTEKLEIPTIKGKIIPVMGAPIQPESPDDRKPPSLFSVENIPEFFDTPTELSTEEKYRYFQKKIQIFVKQYFDANSYKHYDTNVTYRIHTRFIINADGLVENIEVRSINDALEKEAIRVIRKLPKLKPAQENGKPIAVSYSLPIIFRPEDL